jgi:DNA-binding NarL/FixJ family response regulator
MRIVIAEDNAILRDGLVGLLTDRGHEVVAAVGDGDGLRSAVSALRPDVCVVDIRMPPSFTDEGLRAAQYATSSPRSGCSCSRSTSRPATQPS